MPITEAELITERLVLRTLRAEEAPQLAALIGHWDIIKWLTVVPWPYTEQHAHDFIAQSIKVNASLAAPSRFAITARESGTILGHIGIKYMDENPKADEMELGYWLGLPHQGFGYAAESIAAITAHGFAAFGLARIFACTRLDNAASRRALETAGYRYIGEQKPPQRHGRLRGDDGVHAYEITAESART